MNHRRVRIALVAGVISLIGRPVACQAPSTTSQPDVNRKNETLLSAASPFEDLTEYAFAADTEGMKRAMSAYDDQAAGVREVLPAKAREDIDALVATIKEAIRRKDNETAALSSVEAYRVLVESLDADSLIVPVQVSLLDYAGFRSKALLESESIDWPAVQEAAAGAQQNWAAIRSRVNDPALRDAVDLAIAGMDKASGIRDAEMADFAADIDLALVDLLEGYFERSS